jgi:hypothetical protein
MVRLRLEDREPHPLPAPTMEAVVDHRVSSILARTIADDGEAERAAYLGVEGEVPTPSFVQPPAVAT